MDVRRKREENLRHIDGFLVGAETIKRLPLWYIEVAKLTTKVITMDDIHRKLEELNKHFESLNSPDLTMADITSGINDLPEYFWLNSDQIKSLSNADLHRLLLDEFEQLDDKELRQEISDKHIGMYLHKDTKDGIKEVLADRRSSSSKPRHWLLRGLQYLLATLFGTIIASYNPEIRQAFDWILQIISF